MEVRRWEMPPAAGAELLVPAPHTVNQHWGALLQLTTTGQVTCNYMLFENGCYKSEKLFSGENRLLTWHFHGMNRSAPAQRCHATQQHHSVTAGNGAAPGRLVPTAAGTQVWGMPGNRDTELWHQPETTSFFLLPAPCAVLVNVLVSLQ